MQWSARSQATIQAHALADIFMNWQTHCFRQCPTSPVAGVRGYAAASGARGHIGGEDVVGVPVEVLAGAVVAHGGAGVGAPGGDLDIPQVNPGIEHGSHEGVPVGGPAFSGQLNWCYFMMRAAGSDTR